MTLKKWLSKLDTTGMPCNIYIEEDGDNAEPIYCGSMYNIPYWLADMQLAKYNNNEDKDPPIWYAYNIRKYSNDEHGTKGYNGFIITLTEKQKERNMKVFWNKFKKIISSPFYWNIAAATLSAICAGLQFSQKEILLAILWSGNAIGQALLAWLNRRYR